MRTWTQTSTTSNPITSPNNTNRKQNHVVTMNATTNTKQKQMIRGRLQASAIYTQCDHEHKREYDEILKSSQVEK